MANQRRIIHILLALCVPVMVAAQTDSVAPRSTTERPNMDVPGLQQTISGVLMDATCSAIADERSELTRTGRLVPRSSPEPKRRTSERARTEASAATENVPESYGKCKVTSTTTAFAVYGNGKVYMLDRISNQMMQERMAAVTPTPSRWMPITVVGTPTSDNVLTLRSIRK